MLRAHLLSAAVLCLVAISFGRVPRRSVITLCRLFIDEVGNADLKGSATDDNIRYLSLTGVITKRIAHDRTIQPSLDSFKEATLGSGGREIILHRREIVKAIGNFSVLRDHDRQKLFDRELLKIMSSLPYLVNTVTIDKREHIVKYNVWHFEPYHYCLRCIIERYVLWLLRNGYKGDVWAEPRYKKADKKLKSSFRHIYDKGTENISAQTVQSAIITHDISFSPKYANVAGMQIADLIAHPSFRHQRRERDNIAQPDDFGTKLTEILLKSKYARHPESGKIEGWGRKWLP